MPTIRFGSQSPSDPDEEPADWPDTTGQELAAPKGLVLRRAGTPATFSEGNMPTFDALMADLHTVQEAGYWGGIRNLLSHRAKGAVERPTTDAIIERLKQRDRLAAQMAASVEAEEKMRDAGHQANLAAIRRQRELEAALNPPVPAAPPFLYRSSGPTAEPYLDSERVEVLALTLLRDFGESALDGGTGAARRRDLYARLPRVAAEAVERCFLEKAGRLR